MKRYLQLGTTFVFYSCQSWRLLEARRVKRQTCRTYGTADPGKIRWVPLTVHSHYPISFQTNQADSLVTDEGRNSWPSSPARSSLLSLFSMGKNSNIQDCPQKSSDIEQESSSSGKEDVKISFLHLQDALTTHLKWVSSTPVTAPAFAKGYTRQAAATSRDWGISLDY